MRLIRCHVENFGKLHDMTVEFRRECHILCEANGWGKSTLAAFLRVMFFGFEGETKRKGMENERKRFLPWQGGSYGGTVTFETGGKIYTAARSFSDKKINDSFELRDERTNLVSVDFSENLGEELFHINSESFLRTVFIGQNDCTTRTTDSINAKISNFTDSMNDLDSYEKASGALQDVLNKLSPRRKTGMIRQMNDRITGLQTEVSQNRPPRSSIRRYEELVAEEKEKLKEKKREQDEILALQKQVSRVRDRSVRRAVYEQLRTDCEETERACRTAAAWFSGEIPTEEELRDCRSACDEMERAAQGMQLCRLSQEESMQLERLEARRAEDRLVCSHLEQHDSGEQVERLEDESVYESRKRYDSREYRMSQDDKGLNPVNGRNRFRLLSGVALVIVGAICCLCSLFLKFLLSDGIISNISGSLVLFPGLLILGILFLAVGVILIMAGAVIRRQDRERAAREQEAEERARRQEKEWQKHEREENARNRQRLYETLSKKQRDYQTYREQYEQKRGYVENEFVRMGMYDGGDTQADAAQTGFRKTEKSNALSVIMPERHMEAAHAARERLQEIQQRHMEWQRAKTVAGAARLKKEAFESQQEDDISLADEAEQDLPDLELLYQQQRQLEADAEQIRSRLSLYKNQLSSLREQYDEWSQTKETLQSEQEKLDDLQKKYVQAKKAQEYLAVAKETLTARYMEPLMRSFSRYYQILTGTSGMPVEKYHMDANINLTVEEAGMQRETQYLSRGYQDLIGLCLRLSLVDAMYPDEKPFLILDDPFVNLDKEKRAGGMRLLREISENCQIIYVTSTEFRMVES